MENNRDHYYRIGGLSFCLSMPPFDGTLLSAFEEACPGAADVRIRFVFAELPELSAAVPGEAPFYSDGQRSYFRTAEGKVRLVTDEKDGLPLYLDRPEEGGRNILFRKEKASYLSSFLALDFLDLPRRMAEADAFFLHASWVGTEGQALLFTAPKQVGKSTQAALWERFRGASVINGDRVLLRRENGSWLAYGSPYCGTSHITHNACMPVKGIVLLSQAPESRARKAGPGQGFRALMDGASFDLHDRDALAAASTLLQQAALELPFYSLAATPDEQAVIALEAILS